MTDLKLYLFGAPRLVQNDEPIAIGRRKGLALLSYLAIANQPQHRDTLATLLWPEAAQRQARSSLRRVLADLYKVLGPALLRAESDHILLSQEEHELWSDVAHYQMALANANCSDHTTEQLCQTCLPHLREAVDLYQADFLHGFTLRGTPDFAEWQFFQAKTLRQSLIPVLERLTWGHCVWQDYEAALPYAHRWVSLDPLHEPAQQLLMKIYYYSGDTEAALWQHELFAKQLEAEFGVSPSTETATLYEAIKSNRVLEPSSFKERESQDTATPQSRLPSTKKPSHHLPAQPTPFIDRAQDLADVGQFLADPARRLVTLVGPGGMGKTRLALAAAEANQDNFQHGVHFIPLAPLNSTDHIVPAIIETLQIQFFNPDQLKQQLIDYLISRQLLLVLDNFEHLLDGADLVADILEAAPQVKILATSRERLNLRGETMLIIGGMTYPDLETGILFRDAPETYSALNLLKQQARLIQPDFVFDEKNLQEAIQLCHLVQGMPLAIVLATGWLEMLSLAEIRAEIMRSLDFLETEMRDMPDRQRSMGAVFNTSWQRLPSEVQQTFMKLSIFKGGFTREAAEQIAGAGLRELRLLLNKSFIIRNQMDRYEVHELLRQYGYEKLEAAGLEQRVSQKHSSYFLEFMANRKPDLKGPGQGKATRLIKADFENIRLAWEWRIAEKNINAIGHVAEAFQLYSSTSGQYLPIIELLSSAKQKLASVANDNADLSWARFLLHLSFMRAHNLLSDNLLDDLDTCQSIIKLHQAEAEQALHNLVMAHYYVRLTQDLAKCQVFAEKALAQFLDQEDFLYASRCLAAISVVKSQTEDREATLEACYNVLEMAQRAGAPLDISIALHNVAELSFIGGDYQEAEAKCREILSVGKDIDQFFLTPISTLLLSLTNLLNGELVKVQTILEEAWNTFLETTEPQLLAFMTSIFSILTALRQENQTSEQYGHQSLETLSQDPLYSVLANWGLTMSYCNQQNYAKANHHLQQAFNQTNQFGSIASQTWLLPAAAVISAATGQTERALQLLALSTHHPLSPTGWHACWTPLAQLQAACEAEFDTETYQTIWSEGQNLDLEEVVSEWLGVTD